MKTGALEMQAVAEVAAKAELEAVELSDLQLALVGGGCGEIVVA